MVAQAAEFVPRRAVTYVHGSNSRSALRLIHSLCSPALSEDAAFYSATGPSAHEAPTDAEVGGYEQAMEGMAQQTPEGLAEYYQHAMDMVRKLPCHPPLRAISVDTCAEHVAGRRRIQSRRT